MKYQKTNKIKRQQQIFLFIFVQKCTRCYFIQSPMKLLSKHIDIINTKLGTNSKVERSKMGFAGRKESEGKGTNLNQCKVAIF